MKLIDITKQFTTDGKCLDYLEQMRWPHGEIGCVHCGEIGRISKITREKKGKNQRTRIYQCLACGKQFSATSGTIFNDTHLPLIKWFMAIALICEAKKGISAKQVERHLGVNYRTAWHLCHRIREAMKDVVGDHGLAMTRDAVAYASEILSDDWLTLLAMSQNCICTLSIGKSGTVGYSLPQFENRKQKTGIGEMIYNAPNVRRRCRWAPVNGRLGSARQSGAY
jgi:transposase-like protein